MDTAWNTRRIHFFGYGHEHNDNQRGAEFFRAQAEMLPAMVTVATGFKTDRDHHAVYIVVMPTHPIIGAAIEDITTRDCPCRVIVDIHADFWLPGFEPGSPEAMAWWRSDGRLGRLERSIAAADLTVVPDAQYVPSVSQFTDRIAIVPDLDAGEIEHAKGWTQALMIATQRTR